MSKSRVYLEAIAKQKMKETKEWWKYLSRGYVYIVGNKQLCYYKIGLTQKLERPDSRVKTIQRGVPFELDVTRYWFVEFAFPFERLLHYEFQDKHIRGEWFSFQPEDLEETFKKIQELTVRVKRIPPPGSEPPPPIPDPPDVESTT